MYKIPSSDQLQFNTKINLYILINHSPCSQLYLSKIIDKLDILRGTAPPTPKRSKISMFCALSQNYQHLFEKIMYASYSKLSKELKNSIKIMVGQAVLELLIQNQHFDCFDL